MLTSSHIDFKSSGGLNNLVLHYLEQNEQLKPFYGHYPDLAGFKALLEQAPYSAMNRELLSEIVLKQCRLVNNVSDASVANAGKLKQKNTYTVTTGHQLCLFTGPLYFIYKIISTINLAEELNTTFPENSFVPVYWMASEDHDFAEVNNFNLFGKNIQWLSERGGAVGDFETKELESLLPAVKEIFGAGEHAQYLLSLFERAYLQQPTLAAATRYLVNELFGEYGLVIIDGNDKQFKEQFREQFRKDIFDNLPYQKVNESIRQLDALGYGAQVNPRQINCFYLDKGSRQRIERSGDKFTLVGSERAFSEAELNGIIDGEPARISPNVTLRPLYQQAILPNIAYVGGPGELAYWLEYKSLFDEFRLLFPILVPRNFILVVDKPTKNKIGKLSFSESDFFRSEQELINAFQVRSNAVFDYREEKENLDSFYQKFAEKISEVDKTLAGSVSAELQKALNGLDMLGGKANKALKQRSETEINQIKAIRQKLFPGGVPQERHDNFAAFYLKYGRSFFTALKQAIQPLVHDQKILTEE